MSNVRSESGLFARSGSRPVATAVAGLVALAVLLLLASFLPYVAAIATLLFLGGNLWIVAYSLFSRPQVALYGLLTLGAGVGLYRLFTAAGRGTVQEG